MIIERCRGQFWWTPRLEVRARILCRSILQRHRADTMAATMMNKCVTFVAAPAACFRAQSRRAPVQSRGSVRVLAQDPASAPDSNVTPDEILACEYSGTCSAGYFGD